MNQPGPFAAPPPPAYVSPGRRLRLAQVGVGSAMAVGGLSLGLSVASAVVALGAADVDPSGRRARLTALDAPQEQVDQIVLLGNLELAAAVPGLLATILAAVGVIRWQSAALRNFEPLAVPPSRYSPVVAGLVWFVPILNLFRPKQTFDEIWRSGDPQAPAYPTVADFRKLPLHRLLLPWWVCWVGSGVVTAAAIPVPIDTLGGVVDNALVNVGVQLLTILAGWAFLRILPEAGRRQDARHARLAQPAAGPAAQTPTDSGSADRWWAPGPAAWTSP